MLGRAKAALAEAQAKIDEADRKYGISDAVSEASKNLGKKIDEVDEKYAISASVGAAVDTVNQKVETTYDGLDQKYAITEKKAKAGAAIDEFTDEAAAKAYRVAAEVKVGLAIGHVEIDPWAGGPRGEFLVRPVVPQDDGTFAYLSDRPPRFPEGFSGPDDVALRMEVGNSGITITTRDGGAQIEWAPRTLALDCLECWQVFHQEEGVPGVGGLVGLRLIDQQPGVRAQLAFEVLGKQTAARVCSLLDSLTFRYSVHKPRVVPAIFVSFGATAVVVANPLCESTVPVADVSEPQLKSEAVQTAGPAAPEPASVADSGGATEAEDDYAERLAYTFTLMDKHGHGHVSFVQFLSWWKARSAEAGEGRISDETLKSSQVAFREYDTNENGTIELEELDALLRALDLIRFVPEALPQAETGPSQEVSDPSASGSGDDASQDVWLSRFDFRDQLVAALALSPDGREWPAHLVPKWPYVHRRGMLEQGQDRSAAALDEFEIEKSAPGQPGDGDGAATGGVTVDGVLEGMDSLATRAANPLRKIVTGDKARFTADGFDLNLTYIEDRVIVMGMPAEQTLHKMTRNPAAEVSQFFESKHPAKYRIYNLCIEQYSCYQSGAERFASGSVLHYPSCDHNPGRLSMMHHFALSVHAYLQADPEHVVAVHCKAGKGRTGTFVCAALMLMNGLSAAAALTRFEAKRTSEEALKEGKTEGVRAASQLQYVRAYEQLLRAGTEALNRSLLAPPVLEFHAMQLRHGPTTRGLVTGDAASDMWLTVLVDQMCGLDHPASGVAFCSSSPLADHTKTESNLHFDCLSRSSIDSLPAVPTGESQASDVVIGLDGGAVYGPSVPTSVCGDVRLQFFMHRGRRGAGDGGRLPAPELVAYCWLHTAVIAADGDGVVTLPLDWVDLVKPWSKQALIDSGLGNLTVCLGVQKGALTDSSAPVLSNPLAMDDDEEECDGVGPRTEF